MEKNNSNNNRIAVKFESDIPLMLRDGTITYVDIFRPDKEDKLPALLYRTPYDKSTLHTRTYSLDAIKAAMHGYVVVIQDVRGRYSSGGEFYPFVNEMSDGYDSIEWVVSQPWCDGNIGMYGSSYSGATQWLAAKTNPPGLRAIAPGVTGSNYHDGWAWKGGAFQYAFNLWWTIGPLVTDNWESLSNRHYLSPALYDLLIEFKDNLMEHFFKLPMDKIPDLEGDFARYYFDWLQHSEYDEYWKEISIEESYSEITVPAFNYGGWYDIFLSGTIKNYNQMKKVAPNQNSKEGQRLLIGPWDHENISCDVAGETYFGSNASTGYRINLQQELLDYFDYWLQGKKDRLEKLSPVKIFVMGKNIWRDEKEWPLSRTENTTFYLRSKGKANSLSGDGWLDKVIPNDKELPDVYLFNPIDPVPTRGGSTLCEAGLLPSGGFDQTSIESRSDVLVFTTEPLSNDLEVTGYVVLRLYASRSAKDTDFTGKLVDVSPDGYARNITDGILRARFRNGNEQPDFINPGEIYEYVIDMGSTSNVFKKGHSIRVEVSSSNFPKYDRNANTGEPIGSDVQLISALQTIYHNGPYPSCIELPVIPPTYEFRKTQQQSDIAYPDARTF